MTSRVASHRDLLVWQRGMLIAEQVYLLTRGFPRDELFGLTSQMRRAAVSVPANIAEGYGRGTQASYLSFLRIARGSLLELETHLILAARVGLASDTAVDGLAADIAEVGRMLQALITKVRDTPPVR
ncbi:four helix bundle protein [Sphingomonas bacterium]|uniref:four helix bundle protein n=1 Tax=Sphingomonas bacterium TaxID=1895847 RepID=UPI00266ED206|nr:four helix bundle protein [Sphingomonas bacterium]